MRKVKSNKVIVRQSTEVVKANGATRLHVFAILTIMLLSGCVSSNNGKAESQSHQTADQKSSNFIPKQPDPSPKVSDSGIIDSAFEYFPATASQVWNYAIHVRASGSVRIDHPETPADSDIGTYKASFSNFMTGISSMSFSVMGELSIGNSIPLQLVGPKPFPEKIVLTSESIDGISLQNHISTTSPTIDSQNTSQESTSSTSLVTKNGNSSFIVEETGAYRFTGGIVSNKQSRWTYQKTKGLMEFRFLQVDSDPTGIYSTIEVIWGRLE